MVTPYSGLRPVLCTQEAFTNFAITYFLTVVPSQRGEGTLLTGPALRALRLRKAGGRRFPEHARPGTPVSSSGCGDFFKGLLALGK